MSELGVNGPGRSEVSPASIAATGARWVRVVAYPGADIRTWIHGCHDRGVRVLMVLASESIGQTPSNWAGLIGNFRDFYEGLVDAWQVGNESDHVSDSSWTMKPADLNRLLVVARSILGSTAYIVGPGLVSGQPSWAAQIDWGAVSAIALHPYAKWPGTPELSNLISGYAVIGKPLWVTEYHARTIGMAAALRDDPRLQVAMAFCYSDSMVPGFGLIEDPASLADFKAATGGPIAKPPVVPPHPLAPTFDVGRGILDRMAELGDFPGSPELYFHSKDGRTAWSEAIGLSGSRYLWLASANRVFVYPPSAA